AALPLIVLLLAPILLPPTLPLFPYTTLFRSVSTSCRAAASDATRPARRPVRWIPRALSRPSWNAASHSSRSAFCPASRRAAHSRSEEHTSELQSRFDLVCRLLLEKKKT